MSQIQSSKETLLKPLQSVTGVVERRNTWPILANVLLEKKDGTLTFLATDLEIQIAASIPYQDESPALSVTVGAKKFQDILRSLPEDNVVNLDIKDDMMQLKAGSSRFNLQTLPAADFPKLAEDSSVQGKLSVSESRFKQLLSLVHFAMAQQDIRYYLNGLLLVVEGSTLKMVATDGHRLAFATAALDQEYEKQEVILPRKTVIELSKLLSDSDSNFTIEILQAQVKFTFANISLVSKVIDGKFPDYNRVIPVNYQQSFDISRPKLLQALQRAAILSNERVRGVRLVITDRNLRIICSNVDQEEAQEDFPIEYGGNPLDIGFNITYLLDALTSVGQEEVQFSFGDANSSLLMSIPGRDDFKYVVMPMRI